MENLELQEHFWVPIVLPPESPLKSSLSNSEATCQSQHQSRYMRDL